MVASATLMLQQSHINAPAGAANTTARHSTISVRSITRWRRWSLWWGTTRPRRLSFCACMTPRIGSQRRHRLAGHGKPGRVLRAPAHAHAARPRQTGLIDSFDEQVLTPFFTSRSGEEFIDEVLVPSARAYTLATLEPLVGHHAATPLELLRLYDSSDWKPAAGRRLRGHEYPRSRKRSVRRNGARVGFQFETDHVQRTVFGAPIQYRRRTGKSAADVRFRKTSGSAKYVILTGHVMTPALVVINEAAWQKLEAADREGRRLRGHEYPRSRKRSVRRNGARVGFQFETDHVDLGCIAKGILPTW